MPTLLGVTLLTFVFSVTIPGDPALLVVGERASEETLERVREELGLDRPVLLRYGQYLGGLVQGDLGTSLRTRRPIAQELGERLPATLELALAALLFAIVFGVILGIVAATRGGAWDTAARVIAVAGISTPVFWWGLLLILLFYRQLEWLPAQGRFDPFFSPPEALTGLYVLDGLLRGQWQELLTSLRHLVLPAVTLGYVQLALITRMTRTSMLEVLREDYIRTARSKGLKENRINYKHALKSAAAPLVTIIGLTFGELLGGAVITETIFGWPGMGQYAVDAILNLDYPAILGFTLIVGLGFALVNLAVDLTYGFLDPRIRYA
ncbi:MAG TPA: ABC transporter permease [Deinococcales bacterium]|nr:ABC transporter permease [Deinococcales bacterium]